MTSYDVSDHNDPNARKEIEKIAREFCIKYTDVRIMCEYWDSAGWGEGWIDLVWKNGRWVD